MWETHGGIGGRMGTRAMGVHRGGTRGGHAGSGVAWGRGAAPQVEAGAVPKFLAVAGARLRQMWLSCGPRTGAVLASLAVSGGLGGGIWGGSGGAGGTGGAVTPPSPSLSPQGGSCPQLQLLEVDAGQQRSPHPLQVPVEQLQASCPQLQVPAPTRGHPPISTHPRGSHPWAPTCRHPPIGFPPISTHPWGTHLWAPFWAASTCGTPHWWAPTHGAPTQGAPPPGSHPWGTH